MLATAAAQGISETRQFPIPTLVANFDPKDPGVQQTGRHADAIRENLKRVKLPPGFKIDLYAVVPNAHHIAPSPSDYGVFVGTQKNTLWVVTDPDGEAKPDAVRAFAPSLKFRMPDGICFTSDGFLVVVEQNRIRTFSTMELFDGEGRATNSRMLEVVPEGQLVPTKAGVGGNARSCRVGRDKKLYVALGQPVEVPGRAQLEVGSQTGIGGIIRLDPFLGGEREVYAHGIRDAGSIEFNPKDNTLWFTDDQPDDRIDRGVPGEINRITAPGQAFGYPWVQGGARIARNGYDRESPPANSIEPQISTDAGARNLGLAFYTTYRFPAKYRGGLFSVQHGSQDLVKPIGAKVLFTTIKADGTAGRTEVFADGWFDARTHRHFGRPVDVSQLFDGSLLITDDLAGAVYRVTFDGS